MAILPIRVVPDPVLRRPGAAVEVFDQDLKRLAQNMVETMYAAPGVGLAAPQVGVSRRLAVVDVSVGEQEGALHVLVNPQIVEQEGLVTDIEGCLSIPEITERVDRPERIRVRAQDLDGHPFELEAREWLARAICHEVDHLDGILFIQRLHGLRRQRVERRLRKLLQDSAVPAGGGVEP
jgi:peptide deformylase